MRIFLVLSFLLTAFFAQLQQAVGNVLLKWDFDSIEEEVTDRFRPSFIEKQVNASLLMEFGEKNSVGVLRRGFGKVKVKGSGDVEDALLAIGMNSTRPLSGEGGYSLVFSVSPKAGSKIELEGLSFDLGYGTTYSTTNPNYYGPAVQVSLSTNGVNWVQVGKAKTLEIRKPEKFSTGPDSGGAYFMKPGMKLSLRDTLTTEFEENIKLYVRLLIGEEEESKSDRRRVLIDNLAVHGKVSDSASSPQVEAVKAKETDTKSEIESTYPKIEHHLVHHEDETFSGWPANGGAWVWGEEILVGFEQFVFDPNPEGRHHITGDSLGMKFTRSYDGGKTWSPEPERKILPVADRYDLTEPNFAMRLWEEELYFSRDRGLTWEGPVPLPLVEGSSVYARSNYIILDEDTALLFLSTRAAPPEKRARSFVAKLNANGPEVEFLSWVGTDLFEHAHSEDPDETAYNHSIMPSGVQISEDHFVCAVRQRIENDRWTDVFESTDGGRSWRYISELERKSDNPMALTSLGGESIAAIYGWRQEPYGIRAKVSHDAGRNWSDDIILREDSIDSDVGYTRVVKRDDGAMVVLYYHATEGEPTHHIAATVWVPSEEVGTAAF